MNSGRGSSDDLSGYSMTELFRIDAENQLTTLSEGLLALGEGTISPALVLEDLMRAAHSIKGAARVVNQDRAVTISHAMEDVFTKAQEQKDQSFSQERVDLMLKGVDLLKAVIFETQSAPTKEGVAQFVTDCSHLKLAVSVPSQTAEAAGSDPYGAESTIRSLRIDSANLDKLISLTGETRITLNRARQLSREAERLATLHQDVRNELRHVSSLPPNSPLVQDQLLSLMRNLDTVETQMESLRAHLDDYSFEVSQLGNKLSTQALACRMRPFSDCLFSLKRMVREVGRALEKPCHLHIQGETTDVDRDILEKLESALTHLIKNALDHGIESAPERRLMGKKEEGTLEVTAGHVSGRLVIRLSDDGRGIDVESVRRHIIQRGLISDTSANGLTVPEVLEFLFLPGFTMSESLTEFSGRGVGLDAVRNTARLLRGTVRVFSTLGSGCTFELSLPISQALVRCLVFSVAGVPCALPLSRIGGVFTVSESAITQTEGRQHCDWNNHRIGLINAAQVLEFDESGALPGPMPVIVISEAGQYYGIVVTAFLGEEELLLQTLDTSLGKIRDLAATALDQNGAPVLVLDDEDFLLSVKNLAGEGRLRAARASATAVATHQKTILVVDDSLTVRELQRKLLTARGYAVTTAVDGIDGLNTLREGDFDMVITDVDMPRMDGIELVTKIRSSTMWRDMPVMIVSYKDRPEDRQRGLEAGSDYYLAKSSFHSDELARIVEELIGPAGSA